MEPPIATSDQFWSEAFAALKRLAHARLRASGPLTQLNTTALVHETYLRLCHRAGDLSFDSRGEFLGYAGKAMRSIIVDLVRERSSQRAGGELLRVTFDTGAAEAVVIDEEPLRVDHALLDLERVEPRLARVVEMRYFAGLTEVEVAEALGLSERTVRRDWDKARAILKTMLA
jgi:RNA polymerase sigma factor (TIGR02999 family)